MDTIETSNLNRQFLFRRQHVGQSKAAVAAEAVRRFRPSASIKAHQVGFLLVEHALTISPVSAAIRLACHCWPLSSPNALQANVKEPQFGVDFFSGFTLVLNGLDNLDARRHVNRLCLAAKVPLIESGTAGYLGQVSYINALLTKPGLGVLMHCDVLLCALTPYSI